MWLSESTLSWSGSWWIWSLLLEHWALDRNTHRKWDQSISTHRWQITICFILRSTFFFRTYDVLIAFVCQNVFLLYRKKDAGNALLPSALWITLLMLPCWAIDCQHMLEDLLSGTWDPTSWADGHWRVVKKSFNVTLEEVVIYSKSLSWLQEKIQAPIYYPPSSPDFHRSGG